MKPSRRSFLAGASLLLGGSRLLNIFAASATTRAINTPQTILNDARVKLSFGNERMILDDGLQPSMLCTKSGALILQSQISTKPLPQKRIFYPFALSTVVSRDEGETWKTFPLKPGDNGVNMEGGAVQLRDGEIIVLETYVT